jgi:prepilin-type N-terminal cleavage/methylation domain-containing protein
VKCRLRNAECGVFNSESNSGRNAPGSSRHCPRNAAFMRQEGIQHRTLPDKSGVPFAFSIRSGGSAKLRLGFTLIEIVISSAIMALILVSGYACLNAAVSSRKTMEPRLEIFQSARVAMNIMSADLRAACSLSKDYDFLGMHRMLGDVQADNIDFATHNYTPRRPREGDFCQTSFFLEKSPESGLYTLWRRRNPRIGLDPLAGGSREEIASGLLGLKFEYSDGYEWYDSWGDLQGKLQSSRREHYNLEGMPEAVRITLLFDSNPQPVKGPLEGTAPTERAASEPPLVFQTVARLNLAALPPRNATQGTDSGAAPTGNSATLGNAIQKGNL